MSVYSTSNIFTDERLLRRAGEALASRDAGDALCAAMHTNLDRANLDTGDRWLVVPVGSLGASESGTELFTPDNDITLKSIVLLAQDVFTGVDATHTLAVVVKQTTHTIATKTYNNVTVPVDNGWNDLGTLDATYKSVASGVAVTLGLTYTTPVDAPPLLVVIRYAIANLPTLPSAATISSRVRRLFGEAIGNSDLANYHADQIELLGDVPDNFTRMVSIPLPDVTGGGVSDLPFFGANADITIDRVYYAPAFYSTVDSTTFAETAIQLPSDTDPLVVTIKDASGNTIVAATYDSTNVAEVGWNDMGDVDTDFNALAATDVSVMDVSCGNLVHPPGGSLIVLFHLT